MINLPTVTTETCPTSSAEATPSLVLKPGMVTICSPGALQFETYLREGLGEAVIETKLNSGVTYSSSNASVLAITAMNGSASVLSAGIVTVTAQYGTLVASAQVTVMGGETCCDDVKVSTVLLMDNSKSMGMNFNGIYVSKLEAAREIALRYVDEILTKDEVGVLTFSSLAVESQSITSDMDAVSNALADIAQSTGTTRIDVAISAALAVLEEADGEQKVIVLFSDGHEQPEFTATARAALLAKAAAFKASGGIIVCCGIRADVYGFGLLSEISSGGFLLNCFGEGEQPITDSVTLLAGLLGYYCGGTRPPFGYGYSNSGYNSLDQPPSGQYPDPNAENDNEGTFGPMYSSTQEECVTCPVGFSIESTTPLTIESRSVNVWTFVDLGSPVIVKAFRITTILGIAVPVIEGSNDGTTWINITAGLTPWTGVISPAGYLDFTIINALPFSQYRITITNWSFSNGGGPALANDTIAVALLNVTSEVTEQESCATASATSNISQADADAKASALALAQAQNSINCISGVSSNGQAIQFNNGTNEPASAYPSVKFVSGMAGTVTAITVALNQIRHFAFEVVRLVLVAPDGTAVMLWGVDNTTGDSATFIAPTDIVIDDAGATTIPRQAAIPADTYQVTVESGIEAVQLPGVAPTQPYGVALSDFIGVNPNGAWQLFAVHAQFYSVFNPVNAQIIGGWDLTISV